VRFQANPRTRYWYNLKSHPSTHDTLTYLLSNQVHYLHTSPERATHKEPTQGSWGIQYSVTHDKSKQKARFRCKSLRLACTCSAVLVSNHPIALTGIQQTDTQASTAPLRATLQLWRGLAVLAGASWRGLRVWSHTASRGGRGWCPATLRYRTCVCGLWP